MSVKGPLETRLHELLTAADAVLAFAAEHIEEAQKGETDSDISLYNAEANITTCFDFLRECLRIVER